MTIETFKKAEELYKRIEDAGYIIDNAKGCDWIEIVCNDEEIHVGKSTIDVIIEALTREKEKWEKELEAL